MRIGSERIRTWTLALFVVTLSEVGSALRGAVYRAWPCAGLRVQQLLSAGPVPQWELRV